MKRGILLIVCIFLLSIMLLPLVSAVSSQFNPSFNITLQTQEPDPVESGQIVTLNIKVENNGQTSIGDVVLDVVPEYPFTLYQTSSRKNLGVLPSNVKGAYAVIAKVKLKVNDNAVEEDAVIKFNIQDLGGGGVFKKEITVNIETSDAVVGIKDISISPVPAEPGKVSKIRFSVNNEADSMLKEIKVNLDLKNKSLPFSPFGSISEKTISSLPDGEQTFLEYEVLIDPEANVGLYKIPLKLNYQDGKGNKYSSEDVITFLVGETPDLRLYPSKSTFWSGGKTGTVTLEVANAGLGKVKYVELNILEGERYKLISPSSSFYLGNVDLDDTESEELTLSVKGRNEFNLKVNLKYLDGNNNEYTHEYSVPVKIYSRKEALHLGLKESKAGSSIFFLLILLAVLGFIYRKRLKKRLINSRWIKRILP